MVMNVKLFLWLWVAGMWLSTTAVNNLYAQSPTNEEEASSPSKPKNSAVARLCVWGDWKGKELYIQKLKRNKNSRSKYLKVELLNLGYSPEITYRKGKGIVLCTRVVVEEKEEFHPLLKIKIPAQIKSPLVLLFPNKKGGASYQIFDLDASAFGYGGYQIVNLSKAPLIVKLDNKTLKIKAGLSKQIKGARKDGQTMWLRVARKTSNNKLKLVYSAMLKNRKAKRMFLFFYSESKAKGGGIGVKTLIDYKPIKKKKA